MEDGKRREERRRRTEHAPCRWLCLVANHTLLLLVVLARAPLCAVLSVKEERSGSVRVGFQSGGRGGGCRGGSEGLCHPGEVAHGLLGGEVRREEVCRGLREIGRGKTRGEMGEGRVQLRGE